MDLETKYETVRTALKHMYQNNGYLSICTVDKLIRLLGVAPPADTYQMLSALHCVHFKEMSKGLRAKVMQALVDLFHVDNIMVELEFVEMIGRAGAEMPRLISINDICANEKKSRKGFFRLIGASQS